MIVLGLSVRLSRYPYVDPTVTVMRVMLLVVHVSMVRGCEDDGYVGVGDGGGVIVVSVGHAYTWFMYCA